MKDVLEFQLLIINLNTFFIIILHIISIILYLLIPTFYCFLKSRDAFINLSYYIINLVTFFFIGIIAGRSQLNQLIQTL